MFLATKCREKFSTASSVYSSFRCVKIKKEKKRKGKKKEMKKKNRNKLDESILFFMFMFWYFTFIIAYKHVMKAVLLIHKFHGFLDKYKEKFITSIYEIFSFRCVKNNMSATQRAVFRDKHNGMSVM